MVAWVSASCSAGGAAVGGTGPGPRLDPDSPSWARIRAMTAGSSIVAIKRMRHSHCGQRSTSTSEARRISTAHVQYRGLSLAGSAPAPAPVVVAFGSAARLLLTR